MEVFPDLDGQYYSEGACNCAIWLINDYKNAIAGGTERVELEKQTTH